MFLQLHDLRYNNVQDRITLRRVIFFVWKIFPNVSTLDRKREREGKKEEEEEEEKKGGKRKRGKKIFRRKSRALLTAPEASRLSLRMKTDWFKGANSELALLINTRRCALAGVFIFPPAWYLPGHVKQVAWIRARTRIFFTDKAIRNRKYIWVFSITVSRCLSNIRYAAIHPLPANISTSKRGKRRL